MKRREKLQFELVHNSSREKNIINTIIWLRENAHLEMRKSPEKWWNGREEGEEKDEQHFMRKTAWRSQESPIIVSHYDENILSHSTPHWRNHNTERVMKSVGEKSKWGVEWEELIIIVICDLWCHHTAMWPDSLSHSLERNCACSTQNPVLNFPAAHSCLIIRLSKIFPQWI